MKCSGLAWILPLLIPAFCSAQLYQDPFWTRELNGAGEFQLLSDTFDEDAFPDLALGSEDGYCLILIGQGDGSFVVSDSLEIPHPVAELAAGDFDNDTSVDVLVRTLPVSSLYTLLNQGAGNFSAPFASGVSCNHLTVCSFNQDENLDALGATGFMVSFLKGAGDGTFTDSILTPQVDWFYGIDHADCNSDGFEDIVLITLDYVAIYLGDGSGGISPGGGNYGYYPGPTPAATSITTGYLNPDTIPDIVLTTATYSGETVFSLTGNGDGSFETVGSGWLESLFDQSVICDIDLDLKNDVFLAGSPDGLLNILKGDGAGGFNAIPMYEDSGFAATGQAAVADFDIDGDIDFAVIGQTAGGSPEVRVYLNQAVELGIEKQPALVPNLVLRCEPNPFTETLGITFSTFETVVVKISVFNLAGRLVDTLVSGTVDPGQHYAIWNPGPTIPSGGYLICLDSTGNRVVKSVVLLR